MILALTIFVLTLIGKLAIDTRLYYARKPNKHTLGPTLVGLVLVSCSWLAGWISAPMWFLGWICLFDPLYAILIGQRVFYVGTTAKLDIIQRKLPVLILLKYILLAVAIVVYIKKG